MLIVSVHCVYEKMLVFRSEIESDQGQIYFVVIILLFINYVLTQNLNVTQKTSKKLINHLCNKTLLQRFCVDVNRFLLKPLQAFQKRLSISFFSHSLEFI